MPVDAPIVERLDAAAPAMPVDPLAMRGWDSLVAAHGIASVFHTVSWARVLHDTYGHRPVYFCRFAGEQLVAALPMMEVSSAVTGRRGVSLPFTDFCLPLGPASTVSALFQQAVAYARSRSWRSLELRGPTPDLAATIAPESPRESAPETSAPSASSAVGPASLSFYGHALDLRAGPDALFADFDSSVRRAIRKAQAIPLKVDFAADLDAMGAFFRLHCLTRRRHGLPPQPFRFFVNITRHLLEAGRGFIATARLEGRAVAAAVFLHHGREALYKFGASDFRFQQLRANNLVMWESIRRCAGLGCESLHLGRTSFANEGLRRFKLGFGTKEETIDYYKFDLRQDAFVRDTDRVEGWFNHVFRALPTPLLRLAGKVLYPHLA